MKQIKKYITYSIFIFLLILITQRKKVEAYDFENKIDIIYFVENEEYTHIKEKRTIKNNSSKYYIKSD